MESTYKRFIDVTLKELKHELVKEIKEDFTRELRATTKRFKIQRTDKVGFRKKSRRTS
ncbi:hypothetical protein G3567_04640 [Psychroflexus sp. YR1-1]|uniref:Uncharacterized protein n=1 Tax=Psychroflexus aurantiacus TaxID=2709310 RepID=A0A6B3R2Y8_9FLAO|nr:hypothetical protein [Psychroflexus aurantiacus]NEV93437.1 hypothetical protein [Psychroflexus aurantiacus]